MSLNISLLLAAIVMCENQPQTSIGPHGERSQFGLTKRVWAQHMHGIPFVMATESSTAAGQCATLHIKWIRDNLAKCDRWPLSDHAEYSPYLIAVAYNGGWSALSRGKSPESALDYGSRVSCLYFELQQREHK